MNYKENFDCLIIGHSEGNLKRSIKLRELAFGKKSAAYQDIDQAFITIDKVSYTPMDFLNKVNFDTFRGSLSNTDFLWPAILAIGSFLDQHNLSFDYVNNGDDKELIKEKLLNNNYTFVVITTTLYVETFPIIDIVENIRKVNDKVKIIIGGPFISTQTKDAPKSRVNFLLKQLGGDIYVISSEGQMTLVNIINNIKENKNLKYIKNIIYRKDFYDDDIKIEYEDEFEYNELEIEYNDIVKFRNNYEIFKDDVKRGFISISTAKSCPYSCSYCSFPIRAGKYSYLNVDQVEEELDKLHRLGVHTLTFLDDTFNVPKARFKNILRMMIKNKYNFKWNSFFRADQSDDETIELMAEAGCEGVFIGMESASDSQLKNMNKTSRKIHYEKAIPKLKEHNILIHVNFIIGFPGETKETVLETVNFIKELKPTLYKAQMWYCEKLAPIWQEKEKYQIEGEGFEWSHSTMNSNEAMVILDDLLDEIEDSVYTREEGLAIWSYYYLQRKGFELEQIKKFVTTFYKIAFYQRRYQTTEIPGNLFNDLNELAILKTDVSTNKSINDV